MLMHQPSGRVLKTGYCRGHIGNLELETSEPVEEGTDLYKMSKAQPVSFKLKVKESKDSRPTACWIKSDRHPQPCLRDKVGHEVDPLMQVYHSNSNPEAIWDVMHSKEGMASFKNRQSQRYLGCEERDGKWHVCYSSTRHNWCIVGGVSAISPCGAGVISAGSVLLVAAIGLTAGTAAYALGAASAAGAGTVAAAEAAMATGVAASTAGEAAAAAGGAALAVGEAATGFGLVTGTLSASLVETTALTGVAATEVAAATTAAAAASVLGAEAATLTIAATGAATTATAVAVGSSFVASAAFTGFVVVGADSAAAGLWVW